MPTSVNMSTLDDETYVSPYDYDGYVQGGSTGLVISPRGNYTTAFIEFVPTGGGSFVRGEGKTIEEADEALQEILKRHKACGEHSYVAGNYVNGAGICEHCGVFRVDIFTAEDLGLYCNVCGIPTGVKEGRHVLEENIWLCPEHDPETAYMDAYKALFGVAHSQLDTQTSCEITEYQNRLSKMIFGDDPLDPELLQIVQQAVGQLNTRRHPA